MARKLRDDAAGALIVAGGLTAAAFLLSIGAWAGTFKVASAAMAPGKVVVEGHRKAVQHRDGGQVKAVLVREGERVKAGQPLVELDMSDTQAEFAVLKANSLQLAARRARLASELAGTDLRLPMELTKAAAVDPQTQAFVAQERALFEARKLAFAGSVALYQQQIDGGKDQLTGLNGRLSATGRQLDSLRQEKASLEPLAEQGIIAKNRILEMERTAAGLEGDIEGTKTDIAAAASKITEAEIQIAQLAKSRREDVSKEITETELQIANVEPRLIAAREKLANGVIVSPEDGYVYSLAVFSTGAAIAPGQTILEIVPASEPLVLNVEIGAHDIERIRPGQEAIIHLLPYNQRYQGIIKGRLERISADLIQDPQTPNKSYYSGIVSIDQTDLDRAGAEVVPGMPAQVLISVGTRTIAAYFLDPILHIYDYALREQ